MDKALTTWVNPLPSHGLRAVLRFIFILSTSPVFQKTRIICTKSEWTNQPVLHLFPHWNWKKREPVDVWAYYNQADEVELFLNGKSLGTKRKQGDELHVWWRVAFEPGTLKAISRKNGQVVLTSEIKTAGPAASIVLNADRTTIHADETDLSFVKQPGSLMRKATPFRDPITSGISPPAAKEG